MIVADLAGVTRAHGDRTIFAGVTWAVAEGARIGLAGIARRLADPAASGDLAILETILVEQDEHG